jgi:O104-antigen biosynthesis beta-1,3-galactosyltransferase
MKYTALGAIYKNDNARHFKNALISLCEQTIQPNETIIVQDGPVSPELLKIIEDFKMVLNIKKYSFDENRGLGAALRHGVVLAANEWIMRFDSDDINHRQRAERLLEAASQIRCISVVSSDIAEFDDECDDGKRMIRKCSRGYLSKADFLYRNPINHAACLIKRNDIISAGNYNSKYFYLEDYELWLRLISEGRKIFSLSEPLVDVRTNQEMFSRRKGFKYLRVEKQMHRLRVKYNVASPLKSAIIFAIRLAPRFLPLKLLKLVYAETREKRYGS